MADAHKRAFIHRLTRRKRKPEVPDPRLESPAFEPVTGESVAVELRRARQDLGRDLVRIADDLKIRRVYLQAIEDGRFDDLPGAAYAVGFVRAYAEYLGLDSIEVVGRFKDEVDGLNERLHLVFPTPAPESKIPSGAMLLISVLLIALAYGGWYYFSGQDRGMDGQVLDLPETLEPLASSGGDVRVQDPSDPSRHIVLLPAEPMAGGGNQATAGPSQLPQAEDGGPSGQTDQQTEGSEGAADGQAQPEPQTEQPEARAEALPEPGEGESQSDAEAVHEPEAPASFGGGLSAEIEAEPAAEASAAAISSEAPAAAPAALPLPVVGAAHLAIPTAPTLGALLPNDNNRQPRIYGVENAASRVVLRARLDSWVQVHTADESLLLTRVLQPGDSYRVPDLAGLTLITGNAGGLQIEVDGAALPPLGPVGAIRRGIALDPERLLDGSALTQ